MPFDAKELTSWAGALRWRKSGVPFVDAIPRPIYDYPINSGGYGEKSSSNVGQLPASNEPRPVYVVGRPGDRCTCCNRELYGHAVRMLELNCNTGLYSDDRSVAPDDSQGWFPFGVKCAKRVARNGGRVLPRRTEGGRNAV